jgi:heme-degrading monooxygenase HmoA
MSQRFHLAQINIGRTIEPLDHPALQGFVEQLDHINALAERSPGFVWRLQSDDGDATSIQAFDDPRMLVNMSVWESLEALKEYVYSGDHLEMLKQRKSWFEKSDFPLLALWWIPAGTVPTVEQGKAALASLQQYGSTAAAFTFARPWPAPYADDKLPA